MAAKGVPVAKAEADQADASAEASSAALATHPKEAGVGINVTRTLPGASFDDKRVFELRNADLERYGSKTQEEVRVSGAMWKPERQNALSPLQRP